MPQPSQPVCASGHHRAADRRETQEGRPSSPIPVNKADHLDYRTALTSGWPIATGVIEGAYRHLLQDRMDTTGARWSANGAEAVLKLRAVRTNGDVESYWRYHIQREHQRVYQSRYLNAVIAAAAA